MNIKLRHKLILGSQSPRRHNILRMLGVHFEVAIPDIDEKKNIKNLPLNEIPEFLAKKKARVLSNALKKKLVLSYDTVVILGKNILGKPEDSKEALWMLNKLNGRSHRVITGVALSRNGRVIGSTSETTLVKFCQSEASLLKSYSESKDPLDKAGAYGIQGKAAIFVDKINGCYYNVMGVPIQKTIQLLKPYIY